MNELTSAGSQPVRHGSAKLDDLKQYLTQPLLQVPADWRPLVLDFYLGWSHLLKDQLAICARVRHWIESRGLTRDDLMAAFEAVCVPEAESRIRFPGDLFAELSQAVVVTIRERKEAAEKAEKKRREVEELEAAKRDRNSPRFIEVMEHLKASIGKKP